MLSSEARIETDRPGRYLAQFCKHAASIGAGHHGPRMHRGNELGVRGELHVRADWSDTHGTVTFNPWGQCTITAEANTLTLCVEAERGEDLERIKEVVTRDIERFGRRDQLRLTWHRPAEQAGPASEREVEDPTQ